MCKSKIGLSALLVLAVLVLFFSGCGGCGKRATIVSINGDKVAEKEFYARLEAVPVQSPGGQTRAGRYVIQQIIEQKLILQLAEERGVAPTDEQITKRMQRLRNRTGKVRKDEQYKQDLRHRQAYINLVTKGIEIKDSDVKNAYDEALKADPSPFKRPEQVFISQIVTSTKEKIDRAYKLLSDGTDFGTVAMQLSDDAAGARSEGKRDWISRDGQPKIFAEKAFSLGMGKYTKPFKVSEGDQVAWVIVRADKERPAKLWKYAEVKDEIRERMAELQGLRKGTLLRELEQFKRKADIQVKAERYKDVPKEMKKQAAKNIQRLDEQLGGAGAAQ